MESIVVKRALEYKKQLKVDSEIPRNIAKGYNWFLLNTVTPREGVWDKNNNPVVVLEIKELFQEARTGFDTFKGIREMNVSNLLFNRICNSLFNTYGGDNIPLWCPVIIYRYDKYSQAYEAKLRLEGKDGKGRVRYVLATPKEFDFNNLVSKYNKRKDFTEINGWLR